MNTNFVMGGLTPLRRCGRPPPALVVERNRRPPRRTWVSLNVQAGPWSTFLPSVGGSLYLGVDISQATFDVMLLDNTTRRHKVFANTTAGFEALASWLGSDSGRSCHVCMEATGRYHLSLATSLYEAHYTVSVVNPARTKAYGLSRMSRNKTDKTDALLLAQYAQSEHPPSWHPAPSESQALTALVHRLEELEAARQQELNRVEGTMNVYVRQSLDAHLAYLELEIAELQQHLDEHVEAHQQMRRQVELLTSIPGALIRTARKLLAEIQLVDFEHAKQVAAYAGLTPQQRTSGSSLRGRTRLSKMGNASLRKAMYFPAISAMRWNPIVKAFCANLQARGKPKMVIVGAAMRKLLHIIYGVLKHGVPFSPAGWPQAAA
jgi:transposase